MAANNLQWKLIPIDLENAKNLRCDEPRIILLNSSEPLLDPRSQPLKVPSAPKIYFKWPASVPQHASETKQEEYFEYKKPIFTWHIPSRSNHDEKLLSNAQDIKPSVSDLEEGEIPSDQCVDDSKQPGPMLKRYRANGWLSDK